MSAALFDAPPAGRLLLGQNFSAEYGIVVYNADPRKPSGHPKLVVQTGEDAT